MGGEAATNGCALLACQDKRRIGRLYPSKIASSTRSNAVDASIHQRSFKARQSNKGGAGQNKQS